MKTLADQTFLTEALEELAKCQTEAQVGTWSETYCSGEDYIHLPDALSQELEAAYRKRVAHVLGGLA